MPEEEVITSALSETTSAATTTNNIDWTHVWQVVVEWCVNTGVKVILAIIVLIISFKIINLLSKKITKHLEKRKADATLSRALVNVTRISLKILIVLCLVGFLGVQTSSIAAVITSAGVGIGLAIQGTLSNFAGGVILIVMRPFKLDDFIIAQGEKGTVEDIKLFYTTLRTPDNRVVYIPNGSLANGVIVNNSVKETRRLDIVMQVSYDTNIELAKNLLKKCMTNNDLVLKDQPIFAEVSEYGNSSINITTRCWVKNKDYWPVNWALLKEYKEQFDENHIVIPFNQLDVTITNNK
ncbi:MAG: mechanosensitive ion channel [Acholeplasmatales bacterium]|nr:mechanosensitive ion channel [Acholeplasmatales bacterium]